MTRLLDVTLMRCGRDVPFVKSQLLIRAKFLSDVLEKPDIVCCGGVTVEIFKFLYKMPSSKNGLHYPYTLLLEKLLRKPSSNVMGRIELFAVLHNLLPS